MSAPSLARIGFVAQDTPPYAGFRVRRSSSWATSEPVVGRDLAIAAFGSSTSTRPASGTLSGGQRAQLALALATGKRPELLVLDEPLASLDPLARREFLGSLMEAAAETEVTVLLSSHLVADMERVCDYLIVLSAARVQVIGEVEELLATHKVLTGPRRDHVAADVISATHTDRQSTLFVRITGPIADPVWSVHDVSLEVLVLAYLAQPTASAFPAPSAGTPAATD